MSVERITLPPNSYARFADCYDGIRFDQFSLSLADRVERTIEKTGASRILELACGTGFADQSESEARLPLWPVSRSSPISTISLR